MIAARFLDDSARIAEGIAIAVVVCVLALLVRALVGAPRTAWDPAGRMARGRELALLGVVLAAAAATRLA